MNPTGICRPGLRLKDFRRHEEAERLAVMQGDGSVFVHHNLLNQVAQDGAFARGRCLCVELRQVEECLGNLRNLGKDLCVSLLRRSELALIRLEHGMQLSVLIVEHCLFDLAAQSNIEQSRNLAASFGEAFLDRLDLRFEILFDVAQHDARSFEDVSRECFSPSQFSYHRAQLLEDLFFSHVHPAAA